MDEVAQDRLSCHSLRRPISTSGRHTYLADEDDVDDECQMRIYRYIMAVI